jgi:protein-tyrosine phosphatase
LREDHPGVVPAELARRRHDLGEVLARAGVRVTVVAGGELDLGWARSATDADLRLVSYAERGTDLLVETPYSPLPYHFEQMLAELQARGYRLLLAHPERNPGFREQPGRLADIVRAGALVQITASSLAGRLRSEARRFALAAAAEGVAHVIASDTHGAAIARTSLTDGVRAAERVCGARAHWMVTDAPAAVLNGEELPAPPARTRPRGLRRRRFAA